MNDDELGADRMSEVVQMAGKLADRLLDAQIMRKELPADQVRALVDAAVLLEERGVPWPPMMIQVLQAIDAEFRNGDEAPRGAESDGEEAEALEPESGIVGGTIRRLIPKLGRFRDRG